MCVCVCALALVSQLCLTFCNPLDCRLPSSSVHGILQARMLEWIAIPFSRESSWPRDGTQVSCITSKLFSVWGSTIEEIETKCYWAPKSSWVKLPSQRRAQFEGKSTAEKWADAPGTAILSEAMPTQFTQEFTALACGAKSISRVTVVFNVNTSQLTNGWTPEMHLLVKCLVLRLHTSFFTGDEVLRSAHKGQLKP